MGWGLLGVCWLMVILARADAPQLISRYPATGSSPNLFYGVAVSEDSICTVTYGVSNTNGALRRLDRLEARPYYEVFINLPFLRQATVEYFRAGYTTW